MFSLGSESESQKEEGDVGVLIGTSEGDVFSPKATKRETRSFKPSCPIMGGIDPIDQDKFMAWTGGKPLSDWSGLDPSSATEASKPMQYRATGIH